jgi:hypothetical protein
LCVTAAPLTCKALLLLLSLSLSLSLSLWAGVIVGTLHGSSLLLDESRSQLNKLVTAKVKANAWEHVSFVEINNVCDGGLELWEALKAMP